LIFSFYIFLFIVSLVLIFLGYYSETDILKIVAYGLIFMLGFMLISSTPFGSVEDCEYLGNYTNNIKVYGSNFSGYHWDYDFDLNPAQVPDYELLHEKIYNEYEYSCQNIQNRAFGFWISVLGVLGFASVYLQRKGGGIDEE